MADTIVHIGIIGAGGIAHGLHLPALQQVPHARVLACADPQVERARSLASQFSIPDVTTDYEELLARPDIDAVIVATPHPLHAPIAIAAFDAGKHVLIQKPMATSYADAVAVVEHWQRSGRVGMALPYQWIPALHEAKRRIEVGEIGQIHTARSHISHLGPDPVRQAWFYRRAEAHVGALFDMGVYALDLLSMLVGPITHVTGFVGPWNPTAEVEERATLALRFANGAFGSAETNWLTPYNPEGTTLYGTAGTLTVTPRQFRRTPELWLYRGDRSGPVQAWGRVEVPEGHWHVSAHRTFVRCILEGCQPPNSVLYGKYLVELMTGACRAADTGQVIEIESSFEPPALETILRLDW